MRVATLASTGVAFAMAFSVEQAFAVAPSQALWFSLSYVGVRVFGLGLYYKVVSRNADHRSAVLAFAGLSLAGLTAVVAGSLVDPALRTWIWLGTIVLDFAAARLAGDRRDWALHAGHFAERHGLIVIIALGESLIVAGSALTSGVTRTVLATGALAVLMTCLLWWTYFGWVREVLEQELARRQDRERARMGRDAYSFWHFPLVSGIIALAVGFEGAFHPTDDGASQITAAIGIGLALFLIATAGAATPTQTLSIGCAGLVTIIVVEQATVRRRLARL